MANIDKVFRLVDLISNKEQNGVFTTERKNLCAESVSLWWVNQNIGEPEIEQNGRSANDMFYVSDQKITNNIRHLLTPIKLNVNAQGQAQLPSDYLYTSSIRHSISYLQPDGTYKIKEVKVDPVDDGQLSNRLNSDLVGPEKEYPIYTIRNGYIQVYPINLGVINYTYLKLPNIPFWAYVPGTNPQQYDPLNSVDFDFPNDNLNPLALRMCNELGINISDQLLLQYSNQKIKEGA